LISSIAVAEQAVIVFLQVGPGADRLAAAVLPEDRDRPALCF
jgi:hypothetical protein